MSELSVRQYLHNDGSGLTWGYDKQEADNVIARQKLKRCLAMAMWCEREEKRLEAIAPLFDTDKECWEYSSDYWNKWHKRWLEIATKFKEAK